jgi:multiple sugar transport system permease protein
LSYNGSIFLKNKQVFRTFLKSSTQKKMKRNALDVLKSYILITPALVMVGVFLLLPMTQNIYYSFFEYDGYSEPFFIGMENYSELFTDSDFLRSLINTFIWVFFTLCFPVFGGLLIAVFIRNLKFQNLFKSVFYLPLTISFVSTAVIWRYMYSLDLGVINTLLSTLFSRKVEIAWLTDVPLNTFSLIISWTWQQLGTNMVLFLMGLTTIPRSPVEAATIDGANRWQTFIHVTLPMLKPITTVVVAMAIVNSFKVFDLIYVMTNGGPYHSSETLTLTMFKKAFVLSRMGYGSAVSIVLSLFVIGFTGIYILISRKKDQLHY